MKVFKCLKIIIFLTIIFPSQIFAENKIVYFNMDKVLASSKAGTSIKTQLEKIHNSNVANFKKIEENLKSEEKKLVAKKNILSKEDFQKEFNKLKANTNEYKKKRNKDINNVTAKRIDATKKIINLINPILGKYAKENDISIILSKQNIIMGKTELDISDEILKLVDSEIKSFKIK